MKNISIMNVRFFVQLWVYIANFGFYVRNQNHHMVIPTYWGPGDEAKS